MIHARRRILIIIVTVSSVLATKWLWRYAVQVFSNCLLLERVWLLTAYVPCCYAPHISLYSYPLPPPSRS